MRQNNKIAVLNEVRGKKAFVAYGSMPLQVNYEDLVVQFISSSNQLISENLINFMILRLHLLYSI